MNLQERCISYKNLPLNIASLVMLWEVYIHPEDFPEYPDIQNEGLCVYVQQVQFLKDPYKGQVKTFFWRNPKLKAWRINTNDKKKKLLAERVEKYIMEQEDEIVGKYCDSIIAKYIKS